MNAEIAVEQVLDEMTGQLRDRLHERGIQDPCLVGIRTGGVWLAHYIHQRLQLKDALGELDISFYRDDFTQAGLNPTVKPSRLPFETEGRHLVLVDDVIMSGRTIRAAMNELFDYGRPASITLVALIDLAQRELPIQPDIVGRTMKVGAGQRVKLQGPHPLCLEILPRANANGRSV